MVGSKVIVVGDLGTRTAEIRKLNRTGTYVCIDDGTTTRTAPMLDTVTMYGSLENFERQAKEAKEEDLKKMEFERQRIKNMKQGWKKIQKEHGKRK